MEISLSKLLKNAREEIREIADKIIPTLAEKTYVD